MWDILCDLYKSVTLPVIVTSLNENKMKNNIKEIALL